MSKKVKKNKKNLFSKFLIFIDVIALICFFLAYGPYSYFRDLLVTTAMTTMSHKYLAFILYSEDTVKEILDKNKIVESGESTDTSAINTELAEDIGVYESIYEEQILKRDEGNEHYKILEIEEDNWHGYMAVIYNPADIELVFTENYGKSRGDYISTMGKKNNALVAMTASGVQNVRPGVNIITGETVKDGKIFAVGKNINKGGGMIGFNKDNVLVLTKKSAKESIAEFGMDRAVEFGPFLIVNGKPSTFNGSGDGVHPRTAIAQRQDGIVLFVVIEGRRASSVGISLKDLSEFFLKYKAYNAANLDGGGSSALYAVVDGEGKLLNEPGGYNYSGERYMANAWMLIPKEEGKEPDMDVATESE